MRVIGRYFYDGDGKRVKKMAGSEETIFVYDASGKLIGEYSSIVQSGSNAKTVYTTNDHLGSPRINTDATGQVISRHDYHPFGEEIARTGYGSDTIRKQFTGYERDGETGLDFAEARMYFPSHGRFTATDPLLESAEPGSPQTWNRYIYTLNNPLNLVDPTGERPTTHTDRDGNVTDVVNDGKLDVVRHLDVKADGSVDTSVCGDNCAVVVGQTEYWDEFRAHNYETGAIEDHVAEGAKIEFGTSFDGDISRLNSEAKASKLGAVEVAYESTAGQKYDIKTNKTIAPNGPNTGRKLNGKYATARSAGNYLAGLNGATAPVKVPRVLKVGPIPIPWGTKDTYLDQDSYMRIAGGLQKGGKAGAIAAAAGKSYGPAPYYGEIEHVGRRIAAGFQRGVRSRR